MNEFFLADDLLYPLKLFFDHAQILLKQPWVSCLPTLQCPACITCSGAGVGITCLTQTPMNKKFEKINSKMTAKVGQDQSLQRVSNDSMKAVQPCQHTRHFI